MAGEFQRLGLVHYFWGNELDLYNTRFDFLEILPGGGDANGRILRDNFNGNPNHRRSEPLSNATATRL